MSGVSRSYSQSVFRTNLGSPHPLHRSAPMSRSPPSFRSWFNVELLEDPSVPAALAGEVRPVMVAVDQTALNNSVVSANSIYDGVATFDVTTVGNQRFRGSGSLLQDSNPTYDF